MSKPSTHLLRSLPSITVMLEHKLVADWLAQNPRTSVIASLRSAIEDTRAALLDGSLAEPVEIQDLLASAQADLTARATPWLRPVINATGIVLHTGLGRSPLCSTAIDAIVAGASGYCNLEYDLTTGKRGRRNVHVAKLLAAITGAEAATVVNNNAAATLLILQALAAGKEVIVSRGQLVEIGGSFRLPDIMAASGATMVEVGTTNRTRLADYQKAISDNTAVLLRVHTSNYRVVGFCEETPIDQLSALAHEFGLVAVDDLGSGALYDLSCYGLPQEPSVRDSLAAGADLALERLAEAHLRTVVAQ